jgi:hypothetical protein
VAANAYVTIDEIKGRVGVSDTQDNPTLDGALSSACRAIDVWCAQIFYDSGAATAKTFRPTDPYCAEVLPFSTVTGLVIKTDTGDNGGFATTWASTDYELDTYGGDYGLTLGTVPYNKIYAVGSYSFPTCNVRRQTLQVTARWGWSTPPEPVKEAAKILTVDLWKRKDTPFGIATGTVDFGGLRIGRDIMAQVSSLLGPYHVHPVMVG